MAIYRSVQMSFWTDPKVLEDFSTNERLMYLFLLTGPNTNLAGCYPITPRLISVYTGISNAKDVLRSLQDKHKVIVYNETTKEVLIPNWSKYNWNKSERFRKALLDDITMVKDDSFRSYLLGKYNGIDTVSEIPYRVSESSEYGIDTTCSVCSVTDTVSDTVPGTVSDPVEDTVTEVIDHLNEVCGTSYRANGKQNREHVHARLEDGFTKEDCFEVIDKMQEKWGNDPKMRDYLRPQTLFSTKFESYLNMPRGQPKTQSERANDVLLEIIRGGA